MPGDGVSLHSHVPYHNGNSIFNPEWKWGSCLPEFFPLFLLRIAAVSSTIHRESKRRWTEKKVDVSIIIPAKNEVTTIRRCLEGVFGQKTAHAFEIILIDSGSTDGTMAEFPGKFPGITTIRIKPEEFGHGRTRNLGAGVAKGEFLVFLNADAWPADEHWLDSLISGFETG